MFRLIPPVKAIGFEKTSQNLKVAEIKYSRGRPWIESLKTLSLVNDLNIKQFTKQHPVITTGIEGSEILFRNLYLPLVKEKDIEEALAFQAEPLLPYPIDQALLAKQTLAQSSEGTSLSLISLKKEALESHLDQWSQMGIEPEKVGCLQIALCHFVKEYVGAEKIVIALHIQDASTTAILVNAGKVIASFSQQEGLSLLITALSKDLKDDDKDVKVALNQLDFSHLDIHQFPHLQDALLRLKRHITKMSFALVKESKGINSDGIILTGDAVSFKGLTEYLFKDSTIPLLQNLTQTEPIEFNSNEVLLYAIPIGLALNALPTQKESIDFRQNEFAYPNPLKRVSTPLGVYFLSMLILSTLLYFFGQDVLKEEENKIKQNYIDLLAGMGKTYDQFESAYLAKNPTEDKQEIDELDQDQLYDRLAFIQKDIQATPDTFPLFANVPRVSDVLAWLSTHPAIAVDTKSDKNVNGKLFLENFSYNLVKRPEQTKKQEKYQVKVELEFSTTIPKLAREFHDALIEANDFVDPKGEIKWNANRNNYKTSFYLKDRTSYL